MGIPCTVLVGKSLVGKESLLQQVVYYTTQISIGSIFSINLKTNEKYLTLAKVVMYLNIVGIGILLIFSVFMRRALKKFQNKLDETFMTPSDFALMVHNIPKTVTKE